MGFIKFKKGAEQLKSLPHTTHRRERFVVFFFFFFGFKVLSKGFSIILGAIGKKGRSVDFYFYFWMFHGVICKYFGGGLSVYIFVGLESPKILIHVCIGLEAQTEDEDMFEDKHVVL